MRALGERVSILVHYLSLIYENHITKVATTNQNGSMGHTHNYLVDRSERFIAENYMKPLSLSIIASNIYCSPGYLSSLFQKVRGKTLTEAILSIRLSKARSLLMETGLTITEVAFRTGFNGSNYFSRAFRKVYGLSPRGMRQKGNSS